MIIDIFKKICYKNIQQNKIVQAKHIQNNPSIATTAKKALDTKDQQFANNKRIHNFRCLDKVGWENEALTDSFTYICATIGKFKYHLCAGRFTLYQSFYYL